jgi:hypothetical protein
MLKKSLAILALAAGAFLSIPTAAYAVSPYPPIGPCASVLGTVAPDAAVTITFSDGCYAPDEQYDVTVAGSGVITLDGTAAASLGKVATPGGGGTLVVTLPHDATGAYVVNAVGLASQRIWSAKLDVVPIGPPIVAPSEPAANAPAVSAAVASAPVVSAALARTSLASTGYEFRTVALWGAGGLLLVGAAMMLSRAGTTRPASKRTA